MWRRKTIWILLGIVLAIVTTTVAFVIWRKHRQAELDARIAAEVQSMVEERLRSLGRDHEIIRRFGAFRSWNPGGWTRPDYFGMLVSRLEAHGTAEFEKADTDIHIVITTGPKGVELSMSPGDEWLAKNPRASIQLNGRTLRTVFPGGQGTVEVRASATHPAFVAD